MDSLEAKHDADFTQYLISRLKSDLEKKIEQSIEDIENRLRRLIHPLEELSLKAGEFCTLQTQLLGEIKVYAAGWMKNATVVEQAMHEIASTIPSCMRVTALRTYRANIDRLLLAEPQEDDQGAESARADSPQTRDAVVQTDQPITQDAACQTPSCQDEEYSNAGEASITHVAAVTCTAVPREADDEPTSAQGPTDYVDATTPTTRRVGRPKGSLNKKRGRSEIDDANNPSAQPAPCRRSRTTAPASQPGHAPSSEYASSLPSSAKVYNVTGDDQIYAYCCTECIKPSYFDESPFLNRNAFDHAYRHRPNETPRSEAQLHTLFGVRVEGYEADQAFVAKRTKGEQYAFTLIQTVPEQWVRDIEERMRTEREETARAIAAQRPTPSSPAMRTHEQIVPGYRHDGRRIPQYLPQPITTAPLNLPGLVNTSYQTYGPQNALSEIVVSHPYADSPSYTDPRPANDDHFAA